MCVHAPPWASAPSAHPQGVGVQPGLRSSKVSPSSRSSLGGSSEELQPACHAPNAPPHAAQKGGFLNSRGAPPPPARFLAGWSALAGSSVPLLAEAALACWGLAAFGGRRDSGPGCRLGVSCVTCCVRRLHHGSARSELGGWLAFLRGGARLPLRRRVLQGGGWLNGLGHYEAAWRCCRGSVRFESGARPLLHGLRSCWALRVVGGWLVLLGVRAARGGVPSDDR